VAASEWLLNRNGISRSVYAYETISRGKRFGVYDNLVCARVLLMECDGQELNSAGSGFNSVGVTTPS
jgi:hypothetical protein